MKFKRLFIISVLSLLGTTCSINVNAQEFYYQNDMGVTLTQKEYNFYSDMYWDGYQEYITTDEYEYFKNMNIFENPIEKNIITNFPLTRGASVTSHLRTLTIAKVCSEKCIFSLVNRWNENPTIKSYDAIGVRLKGVSLVSKNNVLVTGSNYSKSYSTAKSFDNGFGYSIMVPNVDSIKTTLTFTTTKGGTVYGSYQNAMRNTTESISKQYSIGLGGFGGVLKFTGTAKSIYDNAPGVEINV